MKTREITPGRTYAITSRTGCTITQRMKGETQVDDIPAGQQVYIVAQTGRFEISDDAAWCTECGGSAQMIFKTESA